MKIYWRFRLAFTTPGKRRSYNGCNWPNCRDEFAIIIAMSVATDCGRHCDRYCDNCRRAFNNTSSVASWNRVVTCRFPRKRRKNCHTRALLRTRNTAGMRRWECGPSPASERADLSEGLLHLLLVKVSSEYVLFLKAGRRRRLAAAHRTAAWARVRAWARFYSMDFQNDRRGRAVPPRNIPAETLRDTSLCTPL